jgi:hypothetical protein
MGYNTPAPAIPPRAVLADASSLPLPAATAVFKTLRWWVAAVAWPHIAQVTPKLLALVPTAMLWPAEEEDLWKMYRQLVALASIAGAASRVYCACFILIRTALWHFCHALALKSADACPGVGVQAL